MYFGAISCVHKCSNSRKYSKVLQFSELLYEQSYNSLQVRSYNLMILTFQICKLIVEIIYYKCVYFGTILCKNEYTNSRTISNVFAVFRQDYLFSLISLQVRRYNKMIFTSKVCNHIEEIICYKCMYFGTILCKNEYTNSWKISNGFAVFRTAYVFSLISLQIRCYNEMIMKSKVCKYIEEIICYKYV